MLSFLIRCFVGALLTFNLFADTDMYPTEVAMDSTGQYIYSIWNKFDTDISTVQTSLSTDSGETWQIPTTTPADGGTPNLSKNGKDAFDPQITADSTGQYVYAIWRCITGSSYFIVQTAYSLDYGVTWQYPTSTPADGGSPNLSDDGNNTYTPVIRTSSTGQYVYAIWCRDSNAMIVVQTAYSSDYGVTWQNPTATTGDGGSPNLSDNNGSAYESMIIADSTGQYVYAIWTRSDGVNWVIQTVKSSDYGVSWQKPTSTTGDGGSPDLSNNGKMAMYPCVVSDSTGQYLVAIWQRAGSSNNMLIQVARSADYGVTWINPTTTTGDGGVPNLSNNSEHACFSHLSSDSTGQNVYVIWCIMQGINNRIVEAASSSDYGVTWINPTALNYQVDDNIELPAGPTINTTLSKKYAYVATFNPLVISQKANAIVLVDGIYLENNYTYSNKGDLLKGQYVNSIYWDLVVGAVSYKVYLDSMGTLVYEGTDLQYFDQHMFLKDEKTYLVTWLDSESVESDPSQIVIP
ncbi:MAG: hypothetical protein K1060chlam1_00794 [Candidatus Anoxychlamydiales bacterium]|nr:hypothetical protein [Candidatus Anoxychlamydiales bacterium]